MLDPLDVIKQLSWDTNFFGMEVTSIFFLLCAYFCPIWPALVNPIMTFINKDHEKCHVDLILFLSVWEHETNRSISIVTACSLNWGADTGTPRSPCLPPLLLNCEL